MIANIKKDFPFFVNNPNIVYMDSASTTQKPKVVIDSILDFYEKDNVNPGRSVYSKSTQLSQKVESVRSKIRKFINAKKDNEIYFTSGATEGFEKIAHFLGLGYLCDGDEILYCPNDHKSFIYPWFKVKDILSRMGININLIELKLNGMGIVDKQDLLSKITRRTRLINLTHVHNVYGVDLDIGGIRRLVGDKILLNVDVTQSVGHIDVDVQSMGIDTLSFSGHKMFAAQGVGVTYVNSRLIKKKHEISAQENVFIDHGLDAEKVFLQESGTQNYASILTMGHAIDFINTISLPKIKDHVSELTQYALKNLRAIKGLDFDMGPNFCSCSDGLGILSFGLQHMPSAEAGFILSDNDILVRVGSHCKANDNGADNGGTVRISMHIYNDMKDVDRLVAVLKKMSV